MPDPGLKDADLEIREVVASALRRSQSGEGGTCGKSMVNFNPRESMYMGQA